MRKWQYALTILGAVIYAIAVFLVVEGSILGERTTGFAALLGIMAAVIVIVTSQHHMLSQKAKKS